MSDFERSALAKVTWRLIPFLGLLYFAAFIDRVNVGFAALQMNRDLGFSAYVYGLGSGIFFAGYCLFEVPSTLLLHKVGARRWIARIMISWALLAGGMAFIHGQWSFYILRFLLGVAEAGFFPGVVYYLTYWVPAHRRARFVGLFMTAIPISTAIGAPLSSLILSLDGRGGMAGWQWLFMVETAPSLLLGVMVLKFLPDKPAEATWLSPEEKAWLLRILDDEGRSDARTSRGVAATLLHPRVLALCLCYLGVEMGLYGVIFWLPQIFRQAGFAESAIGDLVALPYGTAAFFMWWWSRHSDRADERVWHIAGASLLAFCGLAGSAFLQHAPLLSLLAVSVGAIGTLAILPIFWTLPAGMLRGAAAAAAIALINASGNVGGFVGPYVIGWIKEATGQFTGGLLSVAGGTLLTGCLVVVLHRRAVVARLTPAV